MRVVKCPRCTIAWDRSLRKHVPFGRCGFCGSRRKVNAEFIKWNDQLQAAHWEQRKRLEAEIPDKLREWEKEWERKNPRPRKFPKQK